MSYRHHGEIYISAEDVACETVLRVLKAMDQGKVIAKKAFTAYTTRVARNYLIDTYRHTAREVTGIGVPEPELVSDGWQVYQPIYAADGFSRVLVAEMYRGMPDDEKLLLLLTIDEAPGREIAEVFGVSENAVRQRISRLRRKLQTRLDAITRQGIVGRAGVSRMPDGLSEMDELGELPWRGASSTLPYNCL
jgi:RNA polymerase sigma factor (sigma-70 family)